MEYCALAVAGSGVEVSALQWKRDLALLPSFDQMQDFAITFHALFGGGLQVGGVGGSDEPDQTGQLQLLGFGEEFEWGSASEA